MFLRDRRGFTLIEVTIILLVLVTLSTIMLPQMGGFNRLARFAKVREDLGALCSVMDKMLNEVMLGAFYGDPRGRRTPIGLLVGAGGTPVKGSASDSKWRLPVGSEFTVPTDHGGAARSFIVDSFDNHPRQNQPLGGDGQRTSNYKNPLDDPDPHGGAGSFFGWRGPYLAGISSDPWGNRYMANVFALWKKPGVYDRRDHFTSAIVCYSAGPDGAVDTTFNQPMNDRDGDGLNGWSFGDDDLGAILSAGGPF